MKETTRMSRDQTDTQAHLLANERERQKLQRNQSKSMFLLCVLITMYDESLHFTSLAGNLAVEKTGNWSLALIPVALVIGLVIGVLVGPRLDLSSTSNGTDGDAAPLQHSARALTSSCCAERGQDPFSPVICASIGRSPGESVPCCDGADRYAITMVCRESREG
jgi:hypothetical protein